MDLVSLLKTIINRLEKIEIPYILTGGLAVSFWGAPRTTHDIDIVIDAREEDKDRIINIFKKDFSISEEAVSHALRERFVFNIIHYKSGLKADFWISKKDLYRKLEFKRRLKRKIFGKDIYILSPEDLILEKMLWYKESQSSRHLEDIKSILEISRPDMSYIKRMAGHHSTIEILEGILRKQ